MRVLVCGGRNYNDTNHVWNVLCEVHNKQNISLVIHGAATGADTEGMNWAQAIEGVKHLPFVADWKNLDVEGVIIKVGRYGPYNAVAGHQRNQRMLDEGKPDLVVAFPGGRGTADMVCRARKADIKVMFADKQRELL